MASYIYKGRPESREERKQRIAMNRFAVKFLLKTLIGGALFIAAFRWVIILLWAMIPQ